MRLSANGNGTNVRGGYRWVVVWLGIGCAVALLLLSNAVRDYRFLSGLLATQQVRHQISQVASPVEQHLRRNEFTPDTLQVALAGVTLGGESIDLRNADGTLLEHLGAELPHSPFPPDEVRSALAQHRQLYRTVSTAQGDLVVEVFPLRTLRRGGALPPALRLPESSPPSDGSRPPEPRIAFLEVALPLRDADPSALNPIRRNLVINITASLSLLATAILCGVGLRSFVRGRRLEEQIEIASQVQTRLLPGPTLELPGVQFATEYRPADQVGGDFYDAFATGAECIAALIGDVSGKGIPAAILMGVIHGAVRTAPWQDSAASHEKESRELNRLLCMHASRNRFASMFWCVYDRTSQALRYVNAGHCPPLLLGRRDGVLTSMRLDCGGPVLGLLPDADYEAATVQACPGDLLVMYSDGLVEATNGAGEEFGDERLASIIEAHLEETPPDLRQTILDALASFAAEGQPQDDLTFAIIRF